MTIHRLLCQNRKNALFVFVYGILAKMYENCMKSIFHRLSLWNSTLAISVYGDQPGKIKKNVFSNRPIT